MKIVRMSLEHCENAEGMVVVIDVLRAFSTAAYAFGAGVKSIMLVASVEEAFQLKKRYPSALTMGEVGGLKIAGFDYGNSPTEIVGQDLAQRDFIQRTTAGTQGVVRSIRAEIILAGSFCCAGATVKYIKKSSAKTLTLVSSGITTDGRGDEDDACADYIERIVNGENPDIASYIRRVRESKNAIKFKAADQTDFPASDLEHCTDVDRFNFAMLVDRQHDLLVMRPVLV